MSHLFAHFAFEVWLRKRTHSRNEYRQLEREVSEEKELLAAYLKRRSLSLVLTSIEGEVKGNRKTRKKTNRLDRQCEAVDNLRPADRTGHGDDEK